MTSAISAGDREYLVARLLHFRGRAGASPLLLSASFGLRRPCYFFGKNFRETP